MENLLTEPKKASPAIGMVGIRKLIGPAVLIKINSGEKRPLTKWKHLTMEHMTLDYLNTLDGGNIGVALGSVSGGLCSIDIDTDKLVAPFMEANPRLKETLQTKGNRGRNFWVRMTGTFPKLKKIKKGKTEVGEWRADGGQTIIAGIHPTGKPYQILTRASPVELDYSEIIWPKGWDAPKLETIYPDEPHPEISREFGPGIFYSINAKGGLVFDGINEPYWAGLFKEQNLAIWEPGEKNFYTYEKPRGLFVRQSEEAISRDVAALLLSEGRTREEHGLTKSRGAMKLRSITNQLKGISEQTGFFDNPPTVIHAQNGMIQIDDEVTFIEFAPAFRSRFQAPVIFQPAATCPRFEEELIHRALPNNDDVELLQKFFGMALLGRNPAQKILILDGTSSAGKSQLSIVLQNLVGQENVTQLRTRHLASRFEMGRYVGRSLLVGVDVEKEFMSTSGAEALKALVGGDYMDVEMKSSNDVTSIKGQFNVVVTSNSRLKVRLANDLPAWARRLCVVRYECDPPKVKIPDFGELLMRDEGSGILNWAIRGAIKLMADLDTVGTIIPSPRQEAIVENLLFESDSVTRFLTKGVVVAEGAISVESLMSAYGAFCQDRGWTPETTDAYALLKDGIFDIYQIPQSHSIEIGGSHVRGYRGIKLRS